ATKLAIALEVPAEYFMFESFVGDRIATSRNRDHEQSAYGSMLSSDVNQDDKSIPLQRVRVTHNVPLLGKAEAGAFRAMFNDNIPAETFIPIDAPELEGVELFAYEVSGPSMNEVFREGDRVICQAFNPKDLRDRDFVILQDTKGPLAEISIKEFRINAKGKWEFWPRSNDARYQEPIAIPEQNDYQQSGISIIGIVLFEAPAPIKRIGRLAVRRD
ncbi:MAG TPA: S24 family peptidase, partial [Asticcacaulis sp.]|nr:S24 family peptidase [Asticcacaulis sp.]